MGVEFLTELLIVVLLTLIVELEMEMLSAFAVLTAKKHQNVRVIEKIITRIKSWHCSEVKPLGQL